MQVLIVEDHVFVADAVGNGLNAMPNITGVDHVTNVEGALAHLNANPGYRLIVLDLQLEGLSGFDALEMLRDRFSHIPVLVFSADYSRESIERVYELGARGYLSKRAPMPELLRAIEIVMQGDNYVSVEAAQVLGPHMVQTEIGGDTIRRLSPRQTQILRRLLQGLPNKVIARELIIAVGTVKAHANSIYTMFGVHNRAELVARSSALGVNRLLSKLPPSPAERTGTAGDDEEPEAAIA